MKKNIYNRITRIAVDYANIKPDEITDICMIEAEGLIEVDFSTEWMDYVCYVEKNGEVCGFFPSPIFESDPDLICTLPERIDAVQADNSGEECA